MKQSPESPSGLNTSIFTAKNIANAGIKTALQVATAGAILAPFFLPVTTEAAPVNRLCKTGVGGNAHPCTTTNPPRLQPTTTQDPYDARIERFIQSQKEALARTEEINRSNAHDSLLKILFPIPSFLSNLFKDRSNQGYAR